MAASLAAAGTLTGAEVRFVETAAEAGVDFVHASGAIGERWTVEIVGAGVGLLDFDDDGRLDIWLVQGGPLAGARRPCDRLYRGVGAAGELRFEDVTEATGLCADRYGMGIATEDVDGDGDTDVFLANFGANQLLLNEGGGAFRDATAASGVDGERWSIAASFADVDADGRPDLYVANYLDYRVGGQPPCYSPSGALAYCPPGTFPRAGDRLYRNLGGGRFEDVGARAGIAAARGAGMGVVADDFDADGRVDFYVANDADENLLWRNLGDGRFEDIALAAGASVNGEGVAEASMGVLADDFDQDGDADVFLTHDLGESNTLLVNDGAGAFEDQTLAWGLAESTLAYTGFGAGWLDADNDGDLDLYVANGSVRFQEAPGGTASNGTGVAALRQRNQLWLNSGGRHRLVPGHSHQDVSRGAAFGDLDNDGDVDIVVASNHGPARVYRNDSPGAQWLGIDLRRVSGAPATGATVWLQGGSERRRVRTDGGYAAAHDARIVFGLGSDASPRTIRVRWADGLEQRFGPLETGNYHMLRRAPP